MSQLRLIAACAFGLEAIVKRELMALGFDDVKVVTPGRVGFTGSWDSVCLANIWLRCADRVLIEVLRFPAPDFDALFDTIRDHDWTAIVPSDGAFPVNGKSRKSTLTSVPAIQRTVKKALAESLARDHNATELPETGEFYKFEIALLDDEATLSIDTTGPSLHKRGYRKLVGEAPLKETLAAAMINLSVWKASRPLIDPFCGSGTLPIEAALAARNIAPGLHRDFASSDWPQIGDDKWQEARDSARSKIDRDVELRIIGTDRDPEALSLARYHAKLAGVTDDIHFQEKDFADLRSKQEYGCVVCNPPYGERLDEQRRLKGLYESFPSVLQRLPTWSHFVLTSMPGFEYILQKKATRRRKLYNGRIECTYYQYLGPRPPRPTTDVGTEQPNETDAGNVAQSESTAETLPEVLSSAPAADQSPDTKIEPPSPAPAETPQIIPPVPQFEEPTPVFGGLTAQHHDQAELFATRLKKRQRHLRRWPTKRGITCFRIYERDIPELPFVVDRYEDCLHITEYERPHDRDAGQHASWLELMKKTAGKALDVPIQRVFFKSRLKSRQKQYGKVASAAKHFIVSEDGLKFKTNLSDYVDTGLFLDHRNTRKMVRESAQGTHFLNLFAYTGSFSVYAAAGGATTTTTVDWSRTYLDWAQDNMEGNGFDGPEHQFVSEDTLEFLSQTSQTFDLIVCDPPTHSNRKGVEEDWDVQERHVELLSLIHQRLTPGGRLYFSTNFRRFKLDEASLPQYEIKEISSQTVPEDFRNKRIHRCWFMTSKSS